MNADEAAQLAVKVKEKKLIDPPAFARTLLSYALNAIEGESRKGNFGCKVQITAAATQEELSYVLTELHNRSFKVVALGKDAFNTFHYYSYEISW